MILEAAEESLAGPLDLYPKRIFFGKTEFQKAVFDKLESQGTYTVDRKDAASWSMQFEFAKHIATHGVVYWLSKAAVKLALDSDNTLLLRRIGSSTASPFQSEDRLSQRPSQRSANPN